MSQCSTSWASHSSARVKRYWITESSAALTPTPTSTSRLPPPRPACRPDEHGDEHGAEDGGDRDRQAPR